MGVLTALLHSLGLSWLASFAICAALSLGVTGFAAWRVSVFFDHAGMHATRRQLARFGIGDENDDDESGDETAPAPQPGAPRCLTPSADASKVTTSWSTAARCQPDCARPRSNPQCTEAGRPHATTTYRWSTASWPAAPTPPRSHTRS